MKTDRIHLTRNATAVMRRRYLKKDSRGRVNESPADLFRRVALNIAQAEPIFNPRARPDSMAEAFYRLMSRLEFLPNSPTLMNAGREIQQLAACFVLPVEDSLKSIFETVKHTALIHQSGGGTGFSFTRLRPKADPVMSTGGIASGPVSFMKVFNMATEVIKQGGTRRGANMGVLRIDHPDIAEFIAVKENPDELTNFNLSVGVTDDFMRAVQTRREYPLIHPLTGRAVRRLKAHAVFDRMVRAAWKTGEPGILFLDRINRDNATPKLGPIEATNPCGEQPLLPYEACNLGSINLTRMLRRIPRGFEIDYEKLERTVALAVRFLDNVIEMNRYPLSQIEAITKGNRKVGLGIMGFADILIRMGIAYDSPEAVGIAEKLMAFVQQTAWQASEDLAKERGVFPNFDKSSWAKRGRRMRNATTTTIAPTGTLSILAGCSSGIEPLYGVGYVRTVMDNDRLAEIHPLFVRMAKREGLLNPRWLARVAAEGSVRSMRKLPPEIRRLFVTALDIPPAVHVRMQAAFQRFTDNAVSKTVNFPERATPDDVKAVFRLAYEEGLKGVTVYRSGSRRQQVLACSPARVDDC